MTEERVCIFTTNQAFEAAMVKHYLGDNNISCFEINKMDSVYQFGDIEIHVLRDDVIRAKKLIQDFQNK